ncbi:hypothetical protein CN327_00425 [Bacillus cereus]|uniref:hypothetical protein n=1 Tax=Bacillus nitratireducens TaxID=2026193 RepID=UPI000BEBD8EA|nr:hypothetical protein [Bacillus nitratireducens]PEE15403.1 hypothetical protein CON53_24825 [Bacillus cereus]MED0901550.1 hypothetical protein [Bacillus nitratireducens]PES74935.1 hypothetical protein CN509_21185 [Bacillus cereus]PET07760.1 hypothetical protein CN505_07840 [Bacillus cereus]PFF37620.1 hypothetical protein CN327_00425 [Bacillus cereus]
MLKREPSKLIIEGNQLYIPWVHCIIQDNFIVVDSKSRKLQFKIVCPTYKTLVEDNFLDIYLNKYPDFIHKDYSYYYKKINFQGSKINIEGQSFEILNGNIQIDYLSIRTFSIEMELELRASNGLRTMATLYLYPLIKESITDERNMYFSNLIPKVVKEVGLPVGSINGKLIEELSLEDFSVAPIWEWDYENESVDYQDETWVRPSVATNIFEFGNADVHIKADLVLNDEDILYQCILNIGMEQGAQNLSIMEGAVFANEEYIDLRDFLFNPKVNIQKVAFHIQDQTFEKMNPINYREQQWDLIFSLRD